KTTEDELFVFPEPTVRVARLMPEPSLAASPAGSRWGLCCLQEAQPWPTRVELQIRMLAAGGCLSEGSNFICLPAGEAWRQRFAGPGRGPRHRFRSVGRASVRRSPARLRSWRNGDDASASATS